MAARRHPRPSYGIGIICALDVEKAAVEATLDEEHEGLTKMTNDDNVYTLGRIGRHNVVVACLPAGLRGEASAATVVRDLMRSFPIKVGLMVGIGSGIWSESADIRLGDVVVSQPDNMHSGVVQWDFGKMEKEGVFRRTGTLNKPPRHLLIAVQSLKSKHRLRGNEVTRLIQEAFVKFPLIEEEYRHQGRDKDDLYEASYSHPEGDTCDCCDRSRLVRRLPDRRDDQPKVHYGKIASSDEVVKDGFIRDRIAREEGVLCFEMEAPGLVDWFPCVVIRGVCDYADSHKNKRWQAYAAMTAACYCKELLGMVDHQGIAELSQALSKSLDFGRLETRFLSIDSVTPVLLTNPIPHFPDMTGKSIRLFSGNQSSPLHETNLGLDLDLPNKVVCKLAIKSLFECPKYTALSYSWGDHNSTRCIRLDGRDEQVTASLEVALKELAERGVETAWVDALCIDQNNTYEKIYQLSQMGTIFSKAAKVVAWLGPAAEDSDVAMRALSTMCGADDVDQYGPAIVKLLERPYWERVWVIQELAKASNVEVWCGRRMLTWDAFIENLQHWMSTSKLCGTDFDHPILTLKHFRDAERNSRRGAARTLLSTAMIRTIHTKATMRRDKVYALLGLTRDGTETVPTPNYVQDDATVFKDILEHMIVAQGQLDLIFLAGLASNKQQSPSWLPTFHKDISLRIRPWISRCFRDSLGGDVAVECHEGVLRVKGQVLGEVQARSGLATSNPGYQCAQTYLIHIEQQIRICAGLDQTAEDPDRSDAFRADLLAIFWCSQAGEGRSRCPQLRQWFTENADMLYANVTLRSSVKEIQSKVHNGTSTFPTMLHPRDPTVFVPLEEHKWDNFPEIWDWLERLEVSVGIMLRHGVELRSVAHQGRSKLAIVPRSTQATDIVARIANCSLPAVLRGNGDGKHSIVGEVVEDLEWENPYKYRRPKDCDTLVNDEHLAGLSTLTHWPGLHSIDSRTLYLV